MIVAMCVIINQERNVQAARPCNVSETQHQSVVPVVRSPPLLINPHVSSHKKKEKNSGAVGQCCLLLPEPQASCICTRYADIQNSRLSISGAPAAPTTTLSIRLSEMGCCGAPRQRACSRSKMGVGSCTVLYRPGCVLWSLCGSREVRTGTISPKSPWGGLCARSARPGRVTFYR
jgi:hypothetical protein